MIKQIFTFLSFFLFVSLSFSQNDNGTSNYTPLVPISEMDLAHLQSIPELPVTGRESRLVLPVSVDNSTQPYFRTLFQQVGLECGQASSIGLGFTYEMDCARNVPANTQQNQYPTHFAYNFINGGSDAGVSFFETFEILKRCGTPNVADYGGMSYGGPARWMTGYTKYYNAMQNRITDVYNIRVNTPEGIQMLKSWIYNHMENGTVGGVANFYTQYLNVSQQLPSGTPEAGKYVITAWGSSPNHALTIVGYNDSIRWDYNGDGRYTNDIDINGDGVVDVKDWEIGGIKVANTYGGINNWGNQGFCYAMYKTLAEQLSSGGIWNNTVTIMYVKASCTPKLTYKVTLKHSSRTRIKVVAGISQNVNAQEPSSILNLPIFDFQGGDKYMTGGTTEADKTIEFGLDVTPLLSEIISGQPAKFFLQVLENDPSSLATGEIIDFQILDYNNSGNAIACTSLPNFVENGLTTATITTTLNFPLPAITNASLPEAPVNQPYSQQMNVSGGNAPYKWKAVEIYNESYDSYPFPLINEQLLSLTNTGSGYGTKELPFTFPFYGKNYNKIYAHVDGYLMMEENLFPWTFVIYERTFFKNTKNISPYMCKPAMMNTSAGDGIWYSGNQDSCTFRWKEYLYNGSGSTNLNFAITLFPSGKIVFYYGTMQGQNWVKWNTGISNGDGVNYQFAAITDSLSQPTANMRIKFQTGEFPEEMSISETGLFGGTPVNSYQNCPIRFYVEDNNFLHVAKTLNFTTKGLKINYVVHAGSDSLVEYGETVHLDAVLQNIGLNTLNNVLLNVSCNDTTIQLSDSTENVGTMTPNQILTIPNALSFHVSDFIPDMHAFSLHNTIQCQGDVFENNSGFVAYAPVLFVENFTVNDYNNGILQPGESASLVLSVKNSGKSKVTNVNGILTSFDPQLNITQPYGFNDTIEANTTKNFSLNITCQPNCPVIHLAGCKLNLSADKNFRSTDSVYVNVGSIIEDYETGNFSKFPWQFYGEMAWILGNTNSYEGVYSAKSGTITHNQQSVMYLQQHIASGTSISFYKKVSSEVNYDYLIFYIDGVEKGRWCGEVAWSQESYLVPEGLHTFKWTYQKDYSVSSGQDAAWVDYISFPPLEQYLLIVNAGTDTANCGNTPYQLNGTATNAENVWWISTGDGSFNDMYIINPVYTPGTQDVSNGSVMLTLSANRTLCPVTHDNLTLTIQPAPQANAGADAATCAGEQFDLSQSTALNYNSLAWTTSGDGTFDNPAGLHPTYTPGNGDISAGSATLTLTATGGNACNPAISTLLLSIYSSVLAEAGDDQAIPNGTSTTLNGSVSGGSGNFNFHWEPESLLVNPDIANPTTVGLTAPVQFTLTVTDIISACFATDVMNITVSGGPLSVLVTAVPPVVCTGESSQLNALAGGGSGSYTYSWTSDPAGFTSNISNPVVIPTETTTYYANVYDGFNNITSSALVEVPETPATPSSPVGPVQVDIYYNPSSIYTTNSTQNATSYLWTLLPENAGILSLSDTTCTIQWNQVFTGQVMLSVQGENICKTGLASDILFIDVDNSVGINPLITKQNITVFPNPTNGILNIKTDFNQSEPLQFILVDMYGHRIFSTKILSGSPTSNQIDLSLLQNGIYQCILYNTQIQQIFKIVLYK